MSDEIPPFKATVPSDKEWEEHIEWYFSDGKKGKKCDRIWMFVDPKVKFGEEEDDK